MKKGLLLLGFLYGITFTGYAQPSDAAIRRDAIGDGSGVLSFRFTKSTGTRQWNRTTGNWEYVRGVEVKRKSEYPGINLIVLEDVVYQYTGAGGYSFWKVRVLSNEYEGIPNPSAKEIQAILSTDWEKFYGYYYSVITKVLEGPQLDENPGWTWHSPNSVEFRMKLKFDQVIRGKGIETGEGIWKVRLYRDDPKGNWKNFISNRSQEADDIKVLGMKNYSPQQLADFEKQTLQFTMAEQTAQQQASQLAGDYPVPAFSDAEEMLQFLYDVLRNGNPDKFRSVMLQVLAPGFFVEGSRTQLLPLEERNLADVILAVYNNKVKYRDLYCAKPRYTVEHWGNFPYRRDIKIQSVVANCNTLFTVDRVNAGYREGIPVTKLVILSYGIYVRQDPDVISYINSFTDKSRLCPQD